MAGNYEFPLDLCDIPEPDDHYLEMENSSQSAEQECDVELPLPPGSMDIELPTSEEFNKSSCPVLNNEDSETNLNMENIPMPSGHSDKNVFDIPPLDDDNQEKIIKAKPFIKNTALDDSKYSPSKVESDEENQDFITIKPKVLGKEQAKKRLMAFSLSKQPNSAVKKQNKILTPAKSKEKPPNPNKGSGVQEQFRATISAIEEEKRKMMQNMPNYLLLEMSDLAKSTHPLRTSSLHLLEKHKNENGDSRGSSGKDGNISNKSSNRKSIKKNMHRSRSRSRSKRRKRSRSKRRSRSRSRSRSRRRSRSRSVKGSRRRSGSKSKTRKSHSRSRSDTIKPKEDKNKPEKRPLQEADTVQKKDSFEDWKNFKAAGLVLENDSGRSRSRFDEVTGRKDQQQRRSHSPSDPPDFKPVFNYLKKSCKIMTQLEAKPADPGNSAPVLFPEKIVKYTKTKPIISWAENPAHATEFYMTKQMLLENCDQATSSILRSIIDSTKSKNQLETGNLFEAKPLKTRLWYPRQDCVLSVNESLEAEESVIFKKLLGRDDEDERETIVGLKETKSETKDDAEIGKEDKNLDSEEKKKGRPSLERKISLVNDSYLSDEDGEVKEMIVGDVKVQMDLDMNSVKVRSKWDSDYEGEMSEKEAGGYKRDKAAIKESVRKSLPNEKRIGNVKPQRQKTDDLPEKIKVDSLSSHPSRIESKDVEEPSDVPTGNLVSEYEEFLKMVSFDSNNASQTQEVNSAAPPSKLEKPQNKLREKPSEEEICKSSKIGLTDWDQESDEEKSTLKKIPFNKSDTQDEFLLLKEEKSAIKKKKTKKSLQKKKGDKLKSKKKKVIKKASKGKKSKYEDSSSEDSSSDSGSYSDSESDSEESKSSKKKKKKKVSKGKKKSKKDSSSDSESDSDDKKSKKKKRKRKKDGKKKKSLSSDSEEEIQSALLKQLDFKKQLIMKKIEEIDSISERSGKKKEKDNKKKEKESSTETGSVEKSAKSAKKKKTEDKNEKDKKKAKNSGKSGSPQRKISKEFRKDKSSSESESDSSESSVKKKKKTKKEGKRKRDSTESSGSEKKGTKGSKIRGKVKNSKSSSNKKSKKLKKEKSQSSSESDNDDDSKREKKKSKKKENNIKSDDGGEEPSRSSWKENLVLKNPELKSSDSRLSWGEKKLWKKSEKKTKKKEEDDWEASSSVEESSEECKTRESSWDNEGDPKTPGPKSEASNKKEEKVTGVLSEKKLSEKFRNLSEAPSQPVPETLKTSLSNFSFNENSFCSFGQELSRDFFLTERSVSNTQIGESENSRTVLVEPRPFQSVSKDNDGKKPAESELYSPGYSDSDLSDPEVSKSEKISNSNSGSGPKEDVYDPLNCESEASAENNEVELSNIPLPFVSDILLPGETREFPASTPSNADKTAGKGFIQIQPETDPNLPSDLPPLKSSFMTTDFTPVLSSLSDKGTPTKKQVISVKVQQKLISKAASVFQDESDEEVAEPKVKEPVQTEVTECLKEKTSENVSERKQKDLEKNISLDEKEKDRTRERRKEKENRERSRENSRERESKRRRSSSRERRDRSSRRTYSPNKRKRSNTPESNKNREKKEIRSDSFEIEPLKVSNDSNELVESVQQIPVLTGFGMSSDRLWSRSHLPGYTCSEFSNNLIDHAESFDIYPSEDSRHRNRTFEKDYIGQDKKSSTEKSERDERSRKETRKSRSRSLSPRKKRRSKSPERRKSPRNRSPRRRSREKSPFSPRRRSPKRKSPTRRSRSSRSPDRRRKSRSRSPRKRRSSPIRRSRSASPRKYRSPKRRGDSPRRKDSPSRTFSPKESFSPRVNSHFPQPYPTALQNRIPVIGASTEDMELSPSTALESPMGFPHHLPEPAIAESELTNSFYDREYTNEFGSTNYPEEISVNNLITVKNHDIEKPNSPERLSLDQRIELELGVQLKSASQGQNEQYPYQDINPNHFQNSYNCDSASVNNENFYQNQNMQMNTEFNGQYFNGHQQQPPPNYGSFQQYPNPQPVQSSVLQVGNIVEVVPTIQHPPPPPPLPAKPHQIMQVGNVLQVVPSQKTAQPSPVIPPASHNYGPSAPPTVPLVKTQKATAVVAPSSIVPTPNPEAIINPLVKAIQLEREKRRNEKEKRKAEREARRKARQLRREAKLMSVNEKLKKSVQDEGLMLGQEVEDDELLDSSEVPSPPLPVEIITVSSQSTLPPAGKGILITAGFMPKPPSEKKEVKFADGVCPGEGTSSSGGEDIASPPPKPKLPKEKRYKKKKTKVKKKVKVQIIRQIIQDEDDDDEDDLSPPPPPPGSPPPVFFARFPFAGDAQFPVYQTQTTTTTLTTVQYPAQSF